MNIPEELIDLARQRRLIPFVGSGFSSTLGLPTWEAMLQQVCANMEDCPSFDEISEATGGDLLQAAEYLFLRHDRQIGPIRHQIERSFASAKADPMQSGAHVELVNLGAGQIYTTNYDDIIEHTFRDLGYSVTPVVLPKDVALADTERTQVVKYHGDLSHERTLVLTESAYYKRLDFESPMDLKFRSDLLGKSVLFMGYSFRDINIRIIWFKLMEMMRDIPEADRRPSYIVRISPNPALEELYAAVGLRTIVLDPDNEADDNRKKTLLGEFLFDLTVLADTKAMPNNVHERHAFVSATSLERAHGLVSQIKSLSGRVPRYAYPFLGRMDGVVERILTGQVPNHLEAEWQRAAVGLLGTVRVEEAPTVLDRLNDSPELTEYVVRTFQEPGYENARAAKADLLTNDSVWQKVWKHAIGKGLAWEILRNFANEIEYQATQAADEDLAYLAVATKWIESRTLNVEGLEPDSALLPTAQKLLDLATQLYPCIADLTTRKDCPPEFGDIRVKIEERARKFSPFRLDSDDRIYLRTGPHYRESVRHGDEVAESTLR